MKRFAVGDAYHSFIGDEGQDRCKHLGIGTTRRTMTACAGAGFEPRIVVRDERLRDVPGARRRRRRGRLPARLALHPVHPGVVIKPVAELRAGASWGSRCRASTAAQLRSSSDSSRSSLPPTDSAGARPRLRSLIRNESRSGLVKPVRPSGCMRGAHCR
jgi:hypothetical protein